MSLDAAASISVATASVATTSAELFLVPDIPAEMIPFDADPFAPLRAQHELPSFSEALRLNRMLFASQQGMLKIVGRMLAAPQSLLVAHQPARRKQQPRQELTPRQREVIALRLQKLTCRQIGKRLGVHFMTVYGTIKRALPLLDETTIEQLHLKMGPRPNLRKRQAIVERFFLELGRHTLPIGAIERTGRAFSMDKGTARRYLRAAGINTAGEIRRKQIALALQVAAMMDQPFEVMRQKLKVSQATLVRYRKLVREGNHLQGAMELVESPEAGQWWNLTLPNGNGRINLTVRNETVGKDLGLFDRLMEETNRWRFLFHPDKPANQNNPAALAYFKKAGEEHEHLKAGRQRYVANERRFRERYGLPIHTALGG